MPETIAQASDLGREYVVDGVHTRALIGATFSLSTGDRVALRGPSGSGKTTLLHLLAGIDSPTSGTIEWPALGARESLRPAKVAISFQSPSLIPALSVLENVALPLIFGGSDEKTSVERATAMLTRMGLDTIATSLPEELSGGQAQRVSLARALVVGPSLLLADEPTGQQDRANADSLLDLLLEYADEHVMTIVVATHDPEVAARMPSVWDVADGTLRVGAVS